jgi:hypothetical protein
MLPQCAINRAMFVAAYIAMTFIFTRSHDSEHLIQVPAIGLNLRVMLPPSSSGGEMTAIEPTQHLELCMAEPDQTRRSRRYRFAGFFGFCSISSIWRISVASSAGYMHSTRSSCAPIV